MTAPADARPRASTRWRPLRRLLVSVLALSIAVVLVSGFLELEPGWGFNLTSFAGMVSAVATLVVILVVRAVPSQPDDRLDERLRMVRDRAHRVAYSVMCAVVLSVLLAMAIRAVWFDLLPHAEGILRWMVGLTMVSISAPSAVMAWTEPEP